MGGIGNYAAELFGSGPLCGEAVLRAVAEAKGLRSELVPGAATGFCSGLARTGGPCGALLGAVLAVNMLTGRRNPEASDRSLEELHENYGRVQEVVRGFTERFGAMDCTSLCGCDLSTPEGQKKFREGNVYTVCREFVRVAAELAENVLEE
ncbi:MAG: C-GCAxxG-C-C family protein [Desulfovibrionaceae bacterium]